jgi:hypothetical protein
MKTRILENVEAAITKATELFKLNEMEINEEGNLTIYNRKITGHEYIFNNPIMRMNFLSFKQDEQNESKAEMFLEIILFDESGDEYPVSDYIDLDEHEDICFGVLLTGRPEEDVIKDIERYYQIFNEGVKQEM